MNANKFKFKKVTGKTKAEFDGKTINGYHVLFTEINCTEETAEVEKMMNKYKTTNIMDAYEKMTPEEKIILKQYINRRPQ